MNRTQTNALIAAGVLLLTSLVAMIVAMPTDAEVYRRTQNALALKNVLQNRVEPTDSYDDVRALLGEGSIEHIDEGHRYLEWQRTGKMIPNTYRIGDFIVTYDVDSGSAPCLNFRNGRLIHFDVRNFDDVGVTYTEAIRAIFATDTKMNPYTPPGNRALSADGSSPRQTYRLIGFSVVILVTAYLIYQYFWNVPLAAEVTPLVTPSDN